MAREWFELRERDGRAEYAHSRTGRTLARDALMSEGAWNIVRESFFSRFPRAKEIRGENGAVLTTVDCIARGEDPVFEPGTDLLLSGGGSVLKARVVAIQMPFPGCGDPAYLLKDGRMLSWNGRTECWVLRSGFNEIAVSLARKAVRRRTERKDAVIEVPSNTGALSCP